MLHSVNNAPLINPMGELSVSSKGLESYLKVFRRWKYQMISMDDFLNNRFDSKQNYVVLTFDDGYKDNLTVAMPILKKYDAHATIFVNPSYVSDESDPHSDWGFMTWDEIDKAENSGVFDIQAHTMTHEFVFTSDKIIDYYTPDKFRKYYWVAWMLFPEAPKQWNGDANKYKDMIPVGYPIFEYGRRVSNRKFTPNKDYVDFIIDCYKKDETDKIFQYDKEHGIYESDEQFKDYVNWEIAECKAVLEERLKKEIHTLCFPGGGYTDFALDSARFSGYRCYMAASRMRVGNNNAHFEELCRGNFVGFNRTAFSLIHPGFLPDFFFDYWIAKLSLGAYQNKKVCILIKKVLSVVWHT